MLYIYTALFLSAVLCLTGLILSVINLEKYNFGLYIALVAIVAFTVALAFFVVKPRACLGPKWFLKLLGQDAATRRLGAGQSDFNGPDTTNDGVGGPGGRRLMFFGFNTAAFFHSEFAPGYTSRGADSRTLTQTAKLLERCHHPILGAVRFGIDDDDLEKGDSPGRALEDPPSTTLIPPTPPSLDGEDGKDEAQAADPSAPKLETRVRSWTFTCVPTSADLESESRKRVDSSVECARHWQELFARHNRTLLLQASFPLSERMPSALYNLRDRTDDSSTASNSKSWSTEEVVHLDEFLNSTPSISNAKGSKPKLPPSSSSSDHQKISDPQSPLSESTKPPSRKNALSPNSDDPHSWRRSRTVTVKYVPVKEEWIAKPLMAGLYRKKSRSANAMFAILNGKGDSSPWWSSVTSLFRRGSTIQHRNDSSHRV